MVWFLLALSRIYRCTKRYRNEYESAVLSSSTPISISYFIVIHIISDIIMYPEVFLYRSLVRAITSLKVSQKNDFIQGFEYSDVISYGFEKKKNKQTISISDNLSETREENSLSTFTLLIFHSMTPCFQVKAYRKPLSLFLYYLNRNGEIFYLSK